MDNTEIEIANLLLENQTQEGWYDSDAFDKLYTRFVDVKRYDLALKMVEIRALKDIFEAFERLLERK